MKNQSYKHSKTSAKATALPVVHPTNKVSDLCHSVNSLSFSRWFSELPIVWICLFLAAVSLYPTFVYANNESGAANPWETLVKWIPVLLTKGFSQNLLISFFTMLFGSLFGVVLGMGQISIHSWLRKICYLITQLFRNSPWLVLLFIIMLSLPFQIEIGGVTIDIPDWYKAVIGLALPIMANISEIVRGAIQSVPNGQWEASESLAFTRMQTLWRVILPQIVKRMIPPWMNWYAILAMATPLVSILGVDELVTMSRQAMEAESNDPALLVPFYSFCLFIFFVYTYPIARLTIRLEKKYAVKL